MYFPFSFLLFFLLLPLILCCFVCFVFKCKRTDDLGTPLGTYLLQAGGRARALIGMGCGAGRENARGWARGRDGLAGSQARTLSAWGHGAAQV